MIEQLRLAWRGRYFCQAFFIGKHVDQGGLTYITAANKGILRPVRCRTLFIISAANYVFRVFDLHCAARYFHISYSAVSYSLFLADLPLPACLIYYHMIILFPSKTQKRARRSRWLRCLTV